MAAIKLRTVTFADARVRRLLRRDFELVWVRLEPSIPIRLQESFTAEELAGVGAGFGGRNVQMSVTTPDGRAVARLAGWWSAEDFAAWLSFGSAANPDALDEAASSAVEELNAAGSSRDDVRRQEIQRLMAWFRVVRADQRPDVRDLLKEAQGLLEAFGC